MKRVLQGVGAVIVALLMAGGGWVAWNWAIVSAIPQLPGSYESKEYCSCRFVSGRDDAFCEGFVKQSTIPMQGRWVDEATKTVTARALWRSESARYVDAKRGCVLVRE